uniref:Uncharacterized protein n=1 Tax=Cacopsylla melanoneura TaxID=428564 RepID=A0A8D8LXA4_9HEMI
MFNLVSSPKAYNANSQVPLYFLWFSSDIPTVLCAQMFVFVYPVIFYISFIFKQIEFRAFCPFSSYNYSLATMLVGAEILNEIDIWKRCLLVEPETSIRLSKRCIIFIYFFHLNSKEYFLCVKFHFS